mgnify:CR=1 FL=1
MPNKNTLFLIDAYSLIYRSYYAFIKNPRINSKGMNTSAIFGFITTLMEIIKNQAPSHIAVAFDSATLTFRHNIFPQYKANREETPEDIRKSIPIIKDLLQAFNISVLQVDDYEADDIIGTISLKAQAQGFVTYMMTPDKDYAQLVDENIFIYKPGKSGGHAEILGIPEILARFQINHPDQIRDILALMGDASDNIPGAKGIGEKTAIKLIHEFGSVETLLQNTDKLKGNVKEIVERDKENILLSKQLVTIVRDIPIHFIPETFIRKEINEERVDELFEKLEFRTLRDKLLVKNKQTARSLSVNPQQGMLFDDMPAAEIKQTKQTSKLHISVVDHSYRLIETDHQRQELISMLSHCLEFCFDTETTSLNTLDAQLVAIAFAMKEKEAYMIRFDRDNTKTTAIINEFKGIFENEHIAKCGQNIKYDIQVLRNYGIKVQGTLFDTMLAHYLIQPELRHNLNYMAEQYLNYSPIAIEQLIGDKGKHQRSMHTVDTSVLLDYACEDADITLQLKNILQKKLHKQQLEKLAFDMEMPLTYVLADMELAGVKIDKVALNSFGVVLNDEIKKLEAEIISQIGGQAFNIASPKQLGEVLYEKMKIVDKPKMTKTKQYSTDEEELIKLQDRHPVIGMILEYRSLKKLLTGYIEALPKLIHPGTGKIHTSFNQAQTATGRLSSNNPNLQNIPIREAKGREIRKAFIPSDDEHMLLSADYSQIELRIMAHMSGDNNMIESFLHDADIHAATASRIFNVALTDVTSDMRRKAKTANFGIIYGISVFGLSQRLAIPRQEAKELIDSYFKSFPEVKNYMIRVIEEARKKGFVETLFGRRRYLPDINSNNAVVRGFAERNAINAPIQGTAADIIKLAMIAIHKEIKKRKLRSQMILQVHDELVFDVYKPESEELKKIVKECMESSATLKVPLVVDMGMGTNWLEAH